MTPRDLAEFLGVVTTCLLLGAGGFLALRSLLRLLGDVALVLAWRLLMRSILRGRR